MRMLRCSSCVVNQLFEDVVFRYVDEINLSEVSGYLVTPYLTFFGCMLFVKVK